MPFTTAGGKHSLAANVNGDRAGDPAKIVEAEFCGGWPSGGARRAWADQDRVTVTSPVLRKPVPALLPPKAG
ncbi:hypothetical protein [Streptomyces sp. NPDC058295]|uniref:hypothetical protein n=1 Tax=Streptomyces sp. NPDC058295 TaxID=3346431 RepID=UPI0036E6094B